MKPKNTLIIFGHPDPDSFCGVLADEYQYGAEDAGAEVRRLNVAELKFDPVLHKGYKTVQKLEPDLRRAQQEILWAEHLVFVYPMWWGSMPAVLKGFIDRTIHPGFGFKFHDSESYLWDKLLTGRSARLLVTLDGPPMAVRLLFSDPATQAMKGMTLEFCGIKPVGVSQFGSMKRATRARKLLWRMQVEEMGRKQI